MAIDLRRDSRVFVLYVKNRSEANEDIDIWSTEWAQDECAGAVCQSGLLFPFVPATWRSGLKKEKGVINSRRDSGEGENSAEEKKKKKRKKRLRKKK